MVRIIARQGVIVMLLLLAAGCGYLPDSLPLGGQQNRVPSASIDSINPNEAPAGQTVFFKGRGEDSDGTVVAYRWYSDLDGELSVKSEFETAELSAGTHTIVFRVQDNNGAWSEDEAQSLTVTAPTVPVPVIQMFTADPQTIACGETSMLRWKVTDAESVAIEPGAGEVALSGTFAVSPDKTTSYTLIAVNTHGTVRTQATVTVPSSTTTSGIYETVLDALPDESGSLIKYTSSYERRTAPCTGDNDINLPLRAFLSFDISSIPSDAVVLEAVLDLSDYTVTGEPTYAKGRHGNMGALEVYHYQYGDYDDLDRTDYLKAASLTSGGAFQDYPQDPWRWDIKDSEEGDTTVQGLVNNGASRCQLRIQFFTSTNWDGIADMICFQQATLTIKYILP